MKHFDRQATLALITFLGSLGVAFFVLVCPWALAILNAGVLE